MIAGKAVLVEADRGHYYQTPMNYIQLHPVRPQRGQSDLDDPWSSIEGGYALTPAGKWLQEGSDAARLDAATMGALKGTDPRKMALARLLWEHTAPSQRWIAERLGSNSAVNVSQVLKRTARATSTAEPPRAFAACLTRAK